MRSRPTVWASALSWAVCLGFMATALVVVPPAAATPGENVAARGEHRTPSAGCRGVADPPTGTSATHTLVSGGVQRSYELFIPEAYEPGEQTPLILAFHGRKGTGATLEQFSGLSEVGAIVAYPDGISVAGNTAWAGAPYSPEEDDVLFVKDLLNQLQSEICVDPDRIFATGKSNGGGFAALLACQLPQRIAAFAPVAGAFYDQSTVGCESGRAVPMLDFHGTGDTIIEYDGGVSHGAAFPAITDWMQRWVDNGRCADFFETMIGTDVTVQSWTNCVRGVDVVHYRVAGGGHTWPGEQGNSGPGFATQTVSASTVMYDFFLKHPLRPATPQLHAGCPVVSDGDMAAGRDERLPVRCRRHESVDPSADR